MKAIGLSMFLVQYIYIVLSFVAIYLYGTPITEVESDGKTKIIGGILQNLLEDIGKKSETTGKVYFEAYIM